MKMMGLFRAFTIWSLHTGGIQGIVSEFPNIPDLITLRPLYGSLLTHSKRRVRHTDGPFLTKSRFQTFKKRIHAHITFQLHRRRSRDELCRGNFRLSNAS